MKRIYALVFLWLVSFAVSAQVSEEQADAWYEIAANWVVRPGVLPVAAGVIFAFVLPQRIKMDFPVRWEDDYRRMMTRLTSFICGVVPTIALWPVGWNLSERAPGDKYIIWASGVFAAFIVGAAAPFTYTVIVGWLTKRGYWKPKSGEEHAKIKRSTGDA